MTVAVVVAAEQWRAAQEQADRQRTALIEAVQDARIGGASEYALAKSAGVTRQTVRAWLGKGS